MQLAPVLLALLLLGPVAACHRRPIVALLLLALLLLSSHYSFSCNSRIHQPHTVSHQPPDMPPPSSPSMQRSNGPLTTTVLTKTYQTSSFTSPTSSFGSQYTINGAYSTCELKGEDRVVHDVGGSYLRSETSGVAFVGVFDGHDGPDCSEHCFRGMERRVVEEVGGGRGGLVEEGLKRAFVGVQNDFAGWKDPKECPREGRGEGNTGLSVSTKAIPGCPLSFGGCMCSGGAGRRGGTTATVLFVDQPTSSLLTVYVANCGDSRCILSTNDEPFKDLTIDHRPTEPRERARLRKCTREGIVTVATDRNDTVRLYPGGLAVSRTIGDVALSKAAIPVPDVIKYEIDLSKSGVHRFVLGTDGIYDATETHEINETVRAQDAAASLSPKEMAKLIMKTGLTKCGVKDDMSVLCLDITVTPQDKGEKEDTVRVGSNS